MLSSLKSSYAKLVSIAFILSLALVILSCLMRLSNQGLGCDQWPDCYATVDVAKYASELGITIDNTNSATVQSSKYIPRTLVEQLHRVVASALLLLIFAICMISWRQRRDPKVSLVLPFTLLALCVFLAVLGILFGTPLLRPTVVMANLLGGMVMMALLWWLTLKYFISSNPTTAQTGNFRLWASLSIVAVISQTALGGWVSSNFAALACTTFPQCNGYWWPEMNFLEGFAFRHSLEVDASGKIMSDKATLTSIAMAHRIGAVLVLVLVGWLGFKGVKLGGRLRIVSYAVLALLSIQVFMGITVIIWSSPLAVVVLHNMMAALLWLGILLLLFFVSAERN